MWGFDGSTRCYILGAPPTRLDCTNSFIFWGTKSICLRHNTRVLIETSWCVCVCHMRGSLQCQSSDIASIIPPAAIFCWMVRIQGPHVDKLLTILCISEAGVFHSHMTKAFVQIRNHYIPVYSGYVSIDWISTYCNQSGAVLSDFRHTVTLSLHVAEMVG